CFGPVLGLMRARDLDHAIALQNGTPFGLTGGIHTLDTDEIERWLEQVEVGNAYVNRHITGAIVRRQPFGGWKHSTVAGGEKPGGPAHLPPLGREARTVVFALAVRRGVHPAFRSCCSSRWVRPGGRRPFPGGARSGRTRRGVERPPLPPAPL